MKKQLRRFAAQFNQIEVDDEQAESDDSDTSDDVEIPNKLPRSSGPVTQRSRPIRKLACNFGDQDRMNKTFREEDFSESD